jgi:hypothetical protein
MPPQWLRLANLRKQNLQKVESFQWFGISYPFRAVVDNFEALAKVAGRA